MPKEWERGAWDIARKVVPHHVTDYKGHHPEDFKVPARHTCRICKGEMYFYQMKDNIAQYACNGIGCANNPDSNWKRKFNYESMIAIGNPNLMFELPKPLI